MSNPIGKIDIALWKTEMIDIGVIAIKIETQTKLVAMITVSGFPFETSCSEIEPRKESCKS